MGQFASIPGFGWAGTHDTRRFKLTEGSVYNLEDPLHASFQYPAEFVNSVVSEDERVKVDTFAEKLRGSLSEYFESNGSIKDDLHEFLSTGLSNQRSLKWDIMQISPNTSFSLHAHPNIELIYVISGSIYELRRLGIPLKREFTLLENEGPDISDDTQKFVLRKTSTGNILINEKGSIHLTFTQVEETKLLVLWGGKHANIQKHMYPPSDILGTLPENVTAL